MRLRWFISCSKHGLAHALRVEWPTWEPPRHHPAESGRRQRIRDDLGGLGHGPTLQRRCRLSLRPLERPHCPRHRCLISTSEFHTTVGDKRYRVKRDEGNHFSLAGIRQPAMGNGPFHYRVITVAANPEVARDQDRHGAIIHRQQVMPWLNRTILEVGLLASPAALSSSKRLARSLI
ncbi:SOS response-associated peptidase family protein [Sphingomonas sp. AP4-R1]|uniref:SOS response-associated peptidase family protein n=1 Tax=Sphingomonas sp. AP4-R1 TaxID=2735134 RepID=UPI0020A5A6F5|nr:SOS response-associated peptidase family protein [Sphingomonas sp. AP4-R1]